MSTQKAAAGGLLAAADEFARVTPRRRCLLCHEGTDELRDAVAQLRQRGFSASKIADFCKRTAKTHGHGCEPSPASIDSHFRAHVDWSLYAETTPKSRKRG